MTMKAAGHASGRPRASDAPNDHIARILEEVAGLLEQQDENPFRIRAYRQAATSVRDLDRDIGAVYREGGLGALDEVPGVGASIARAIAEILETGRWRYLDALRGAVDPEHLFATIPGIGPKLSALIHERLGISTLEELELAARDGRLQAIPGFSERRADMVRHALATMLQRLRPRPPVTRRTREEPPVDVLLDVDREYREKAAAGRLPTIAPRRFNPSGESWLPVLHAKRGRWQFTALYSNTARAHELGRERDWVVLYFQDDRGAEHQRTIVTETQGELAGKRVVRGREPESRRFHLRPATAGEGG